MASLKETFEKLWALAAKVAGSFGALDAKTQTSVQTLKCVASLRHCVTASLRHCVTASLRHHHREKAKATRADGKAGSQEGNLICFSSRLSPDCALVGGDGRFRGPM